MPGSAFSGPFMTVFETVAARPPHHELGTMWGVGRQQDWPSLLPRQERPVCTGVGQAKPHGQRGYVQYTCRDKITVLLALPITCGQFSHADSGHLYVDSLPPSLPLWASVRK